MLQRKEDGSPEPKLKVYGWLVGVQLEEGMDPNVISLRLADSIAWLEGAGPASVELLGEIDVVESEQQGGE